MNKEFKEAFDQLFENQEKKLLKMLKQKYNAIKMTA